MCFCSFLMGYNVLEPFILRIVYYYFTINNTLNYIITRHYVILYEVVKWLS